MMFQSNVSAHVALAGVLWFAPVEARAVLQQAQPQGALSLGERGAAVLAPDVTHHWTLRLRAGAYAVVHVRQKGVDVVVHIVDPSGVNRREIDSPTGTTGTEKAAWIADAAGDWTISLQAFEGSPAGAYEIEWVTARAATEADRKILEADSLEILADRFQSQRNYAEAELLLKRALEIREMVLGPDHLELASSLDNLARLYGSQRRDAERERLLERALAIRETIMGPDHPDVASSLNELAGAYMRRGRYDQAEPLITRALAIQEAALGPEHTDVAASLNRLGVLYWGRGRYAEAEPLLKRALAIRQSALGTEHPQVAQSFYSLGMLYDKQGRYPEAEAIYQRAIATYEAVLGPEAPWVGTSLNNLSLLYDKQGRHAEAELALKRALTIWESALGPHHAQVAMGLDNLGRVYMHQGRYAEAEPLLERALTLLEARLGPDHPEVAFRLGGLANLYAIQGRDAEAESLHVRSLAVLDSVLGPDHHYVADVLLNLANLHWRQGRYAEADPLEERALKIHIARLGPDHPEVAVTLCDLALSLFSRQELEGALQHVEKAIRILDATTGFPRWRVGAYALRARIRKALGDDARALDDLTEALNSIEHLRPQVGGGEQTRAGFFGRYAQHFDQMVTWQLEAGQVARAIEYAERGRARVLLDQLAAGRIDLRTGIPAGIRSRLEAREDAARSRLAEYQQRITLLRGREDLSDDERLRRIAALEDSLRGADIEYRAVYQEIKNASPLWRDLITSGGEPVSLSTIQRRLVPPGGYLLLYQIGEAASYLFVIPPAGQESLWLPLTIEETQAALLRAQPGPLNSAGLEHILRTASARDTARGLVSTLAERSEEREPSPPDVWRGTAATLHALWRVLVPEAVWQQLAGVAEVVIVPDSWLHQLPFEALVVRPALGPSETRFWLDEGPAIRYAPSATTLYNMTQRPAARQFGVTNDILTLSDPTFNPTEVAHELGARHAEIPDSLERGDHLAVLRFAASQLTRSSYERVGGSLARLPGTARESKAIREAFGQDRALGKVVELHGVEATERNLRASLTGKRYLHLATHGLVDERRGTLFAALALTPPPTASAEPENDGFLQLYEIYDVKLPEVRLAILSACESNVGLNVEGEGIFALSRGFMAAGARRVIASQWSVDDLSTAELMEDLFRSIARAEQQGQRIDFTRALRDAKRFVRTQRRWAEPHYWAPFVLLGKR